MGRIETFGPTAERLAKAQGDFVVGDDKQGTKVYHFLDTPLARFYKRLGAEDKSDSATDQIRSEFVALMKYAHHWNGARMDAKVGSATLDRVQNSSAGLEAGERYTHHVIVYRNAAKLLGMWSSHVVEHIACLDRPISDCSAHGVMISPYMFRKILRKAARDLAQHWSI
jgi:hypothetical protein